MTDFERERERMVERQLGGRGITDAAVLEAMRAVPREAFVPEELAEFAYEDGPLSIGEGQTISQPYGVALMIEAADPGPNDRVLDVGTGSGYAAAVLSRIVAEVDTIERHASLAEAARARFERLGHGNVHVRVGDGSLGWPERAPYEAILVAAGGPEVPEALLRQLRVGGRLVMPVGERARTQKLLRVRRTDEEHFERDDLGAVAFVPLIGEQGWREEGAAPGAGTRAAAESGPEATAVVGEADLARMIRDAALPLPDPTDPAFGPLFDRLVGGARVVLLGEATHGTSEFYRARAEITRRLVERHGFTVVAAEADWPDAAQIDAYVRRRQAAPSEEPPFARFPTWMWRNAEVREFVEWLHGHNGEVAEPGRRVGFYGLDLYSLNASVRAVLDYLDRMDPEAARVARERYGCLTPWQRDPTTYGRMALRSGYAPCERDVIAMLRDLLDRRLEYLRRGDPDGYLDAEQNARVVADAERYYRIMYYGSAESWNLRDQHMFETLARVMAARGPEARAVVWAHNSHIGNAAATEMGVLREELNVGQLCRERFGEGTLLVGLGTDRGTVAAASDWDGPMEIKRVRPAHPESYERLCRDAGLPAFLLDLRPDDGDDRRGELRHHLLRPRLERAIGVIYRPETELASHYFEAQLPHQFDAWLWFEVTRAVTPLGEGHAEGVPETYPFGV
ncbi:MAG TPA: protein-L-isoaspartate(D-aspartate) O-methyltransferase [Geminicoccaceae bacterium]|nr:protein-L-isoaspartate(D-aspartate) O-methyltransferase [Geminicoccaceae bacterium]